MTELAGALEQYPPVGSRRRYQKPVYVPVDHAAHPAAPRIVALYESGWTIAEIAEVTSPGAYKIRQILQACGVALRSKGQRKVST